MIGGFHVQFKVKDGTTGELAMQRLSTAFERAGTDFENFGERFYPAMIELLQNEEKAQFDAQGRGPSRGAWAQLTPKYAKWKQAHYPGQPILQRSGTLYDALTRDGGHALRAYNARDLTFGTQGVPYASYHQEGTKRMVDRPPLDMGDDLDGQVQKTALKTARDIVREELSPFATVRQVNWESDRVLDFALGDE